jgi:preprotein translocase subunit YajC
MDNQQVIVLVGGLALILVMTVLPQWRARRRKEREKAGLALGSEVMTVGGIFGRVTQLDAGDGRMRVEIAPGVEITLVAGAISRTVESSEPSGEQDPSGDDAAD